MIKKVVTRMHKSHYLVDDNERTLYRGTMQECLSILEVHSADFVDYAISDNRFTLYFTKREGNLILTQSRDAVLKSYTPLNYDNLS